MQDLLSIIERARIEAGGLRTAISRLSKDGWIQVEKEGRNSFYTLSDNGLKEFLPATQIIYNNQKFSTTENWIVAIAPPSGTGLRRESIENLETLKPSFVHSGLAFWPEDKAPSSQELKSYHCISALINQEHPPNWLVNSAASQEMRTSYESLINLLEPMSYNLEQLRNLDPEDALTARILLIHKWRKLALRSANIPYFLLPDNWPAPICAKMVASIYKAVLPNSEDYWPTPSKPGAKQELEARFLEI